MSIDIVVMSSKKKLCKEYESNNACAYLALLAFTVFTATQHDRQNYKRKISSTGDWLLQGLGFKLALKWLGWLPSPKLVLHLATHRSV